MHDPLPHRVEYTRNKHSRAVWRGDTIVIRLARNLSKIEQEMHIQSLLTRMRKMLEKEQGKILIDPFRAVLDGEQTFSITLATGQPFTVVLHPAARTSARRRGDAWHIGVGPQLRRAALHTLLWKLAARQAAPSLRALVHTVNRRTLDVPVRGVNVRFASTQWGSCSAKGMIMLNTALLFLGPQLLEYVIVHELAHRKIASHSDAYWRVVAEALPEYEAAYDRLKTYRLPSLR